MRTRATAVALAAAALAAGAAPAAARLELATFRVEIEGRQHTTWELHHESTGGCDSAADGSGEEVAVFRTPRAVVMRALWDSDTPGDAPTLIGRGATLPRLPLRGTIRRSGTIVDASSPFRRCPVAGESFPTLMPYDTRGRRVGQRIPTRELFAYGKHIAIARGTNRVRIPETSADTDITWTVTFTRTRAR